MKITFVQQDENLSGGNRVIAIYAEKLAGRGHDVLVVSGRNKPPTVLDRLRALRQGRLLPLQPKLSSHLEGRAVRRLTIDHDGPVTDDDLPDADVVIATWWETAFAVAALSPRKGRKVYFVQGHEVHEHLPNHISRGSYFLPLRKITIAQWLVDTMRDVYGDNDVALVHNAVDHSQFHGPPRSRNARPTIGFMYSIAPLKAVDIALEAIELARARLGDVGVVAFGADPPNAALPLPRGAVYHFRPPQDTIRSIYCRCDVWIMSSRSEGFGLPLLEAMACRCPVVATRTGSAPDLIENGRTGYVVDIDDSEELGQRLVDILSTDEAAWSRMSEAAYETAIRHDWDSAATLFEQALLAGAAE